MRLTLSLNAETQKLGRKMIKKLIGVLGGSYTPVLIAEDMQVISTSGGVRIDSEYDLRELPVDDPAGLAYWEKQLGMGAVNEDALQGCVTGFAIDPLESAINNTAALLADEVERMHERAESGRPAGRLAEVFGQHLDKLLAIQLERVRE
ncbi:hypothetical protein [Pseudomonas syringae]|uniref:hypothetical protein n=1 Tax=Pseudomonas syringae TaxID=317 RepID=UPI00067E11A3|nr:hypothetical protein [Pseudomonas syringae]